MNPRLIGLKELQRYVGLGEKSAAKLGREAGAVVRYGTRVLYDREVIDLHITKLREVNNENVS